MATAGVAAVQPPRWTQATAWGLLALDLVAAVVGGALLAVTGFEVAAFLGVAIGAVGLGIVGALVITRRGPMATGWLLLAISTGMLVSMGFRQAVWFAYVEQGRSLAAAQALYLVSDVTFSLWLPLQLLLFFTFPNGRLPSPRWRPVMVVLALVTAAATGTVFAVARFLRDPSVVLTNDSWTTRAGIAPEAEPYLQVYDAVVGVLLVLFVLSIASLIVRLRRADDDERRQLTWVVYSGVAWLVLTPLATVERASSPVLQQLQDAMGGLAVLVLGAGFAVALFRHRLWDVDVVVRRTAVYGLLWLAIVGMYAGAAAGLGVAAGARLPVEVAIGLTVLATLVFEPARHRLEQAADRWVFGRRRSPAQAVHGLAELIDTTETPTDIASQLAATASAAVGLAHVEVRLDGLASAGRGTPNDASSLRVPIRYEGRRFGVLRCQPHAGRVLTSDDEALLTTLAWQVGLAVSHAQLSSRIVQAQETERRRIERNIHDGAQQELIAVLTQLRLARNGMNGDERGEQVLAGIQEGVQEILRNLRELAQGIHPSVLTDGGIVAAVEDRCSRLPIPVTLRVDPSLRRCRFTDEVEGAVHFFVSEALTNVLKHATAAGIGIRLGFDGTILTAQVADDGVGFEPGPALGAGLSGLIDRLHALGGTLSIDSRPGAGTRLAATLRAEPRSWGAT